MKLSPYDNTHYIPVWDCRGCGEKDVILSYSATYHLKHKETGRKIELAWWYCPNCEVIPWDETEIKGYLSVADLKEMGFEEE